MASSYTNNLRLTLPVTGELTGTWGDTVNTGITELVDAAVSGTAAVTHDDSANYTLTVVNGASDEARQMILNVTGTITAARNVVCPSASKLYFVKNATTGGFAITLKTSAGTGVSVPNGKISVLYCDGTNVVSAVSHFSALDIAALTATTADINGGTIDGTVIGGSAQAAGTFTTLGATTGNITTGNITTVNATTVDSTNLEVTNLKAKDGTAAGSIADSTGVVTLASSVLTTTDINGGTIDGTVIGGSAQAAASVTTLTATADSSFTSTGAVKVPAGSTAQRPTGANGKIRYNSDLSRYEGYSGSAWSQIGGGATGGGSDQVFVENDQAVTVDYTITSGKNASSAGPITINSGITVTVPSGSAWTVI